jgi:hypothetical protein
MKKTMEIPIAEELSSKCSVPKDGGMPGSQGFQRDV